MKKPSSRRGNHQIVRSRLIFAPRCFWHYPSIKGVGNTVLASYTYDAAGNIKSKTKTTGSGTDTYTYGNSEWRDLLTAYNGSTITYDTIGNPTKWYDGATMSWVNGRRLASIGATSAHSALSFTYDADGLRLTKTVGSGSSAVQHKYTWQGGRLIAESCGNTTMEFFYDESGRPAILRYNGYLYYYVTNLQGDVVKIIGTSGTSYAEYSYNAWGEVLTATGTLASANPLRYRGYYYDTETKMYYLKSRYYDPALCRFINADGLASTGQGLLGCNMFAYCNNNPVSRKDIDGKEWEFVGAGVQLDASASLGEISGGAGIEVVIYWGTEEAKELGEPVVAVYIYGGGSFNIALLAEDIANITNLLTESVELLKIDGASALEATLLTSKHSLSGAVTLSGFLVFGNEQFVNSKSYTEGFDTFSASYGKGRVSYAWSDCCKTVGVGVSVLGGSAGLSVTRGKSYYFQMYSSA